MINKELMILILLLCITILLTDISFFFKLRQIQRDTLIGNRNRKSERKIYASQTPKNKICLSYIRPYLKRHIQAFDRWHKVYKAYPLLVVLDYAIISVLLSTNLSIGAGYLIFVFILQIVIILIMRVLVFTDGFNTHSKYVRKN